MASPRVLIGLMPALAIVGAAAVWWMRGPAEEVPAPSDSGMEGDVGLAPELPSLAGGAGLGGTAGRAPMGSGVVQGRVLRPDGSPAAFAHVVWMPAIVGITRLPRAGGERLDPSLDSTVADRTGQFAIEIPSEGEFLAIAEPAVGEPSAARDAPDAPAGEDADLYSESSAKFHLEKGKPSPSLNLRLRRPGRIEVRVSDERGRPVEGALVELEYGPRLEADGRGGYFAGGLIPARYVLDVTSPACGPSQVQVEIDEGRTTTQAIQVRCGIRVSGTVVDPTGKPVPEARVRVVAPRTADGEDTVLSTVTCDASGHFELGQLPEGPLRLHADADGFDSLDEFTDVSGDSASVRVRGQWLGRVRVRLQTSDGKPLPSAVEVNVGIPGEPHPYEGTADVNDGVIVVSEFSGEDEQLVVDVPGYAPLVRTVRAAPGKEVDLGTVTLDAGHDVDGVVVTADGASIPRAAVRAAGNRASDTTAADGTFHLHRLPAGPVDVVVSAEGYLTISDLEIVVGAPKKGPLRIVLRRACVVRAKVETADGKVAIGERLVVMPVLDDAEHRLDPEQRAFRTEEDGTFVVSLPPGPYRIQAQEGDRWVLLTEITLAEGEHRDLSLRLPAR